MGETRTGVFGSQLFLLLAFCATLSRSGFGAPKRSAGTPTTPPEVPTRFARASAWVIGLEGLLNLTYAHSSDTYSAADGEGEDVHVTSTTDFLSLSAFAPKVALDAFVINHLSVGLSAGFDESNTTHETTGGGQSYWTSGSTHLLDVTPRVGFAYVASGVGVWIRGGVGINARWESSTPVSPRANPDSNWEVYDTHVEVLGVFMARRDVVVSIGPWMTKLVASTGDWFPGARRPEEAPPTFGVVLGAGLVL